MNFNDILTSGGISLLVLLTLIQIVPIKLNPWSWLWKLIKKGLTALGKAANSEVLTKITNLETDLSAVKNEVSAVQQKVVALSDASDKQAAINARARILRFGDEVLHGKAHTKDHFDSILKDAKMYERYCASHENFENGVTEPTIQRIQDVYKERLERNDFL